MIELEQLEDMFLNIKAKTNWDMSGPMLWGYFFTDRNEEKLRSVIALLEKQGYRFVDLFIPELEKGEKEYFVLHVEKEEIHSAQSLHQRNSELYAFAEHHNLDSYDGMDVGPIGQS